MRASSHLVTVTLKEEFFLPCSEVRYLYLSAMMYKGMTE